MTRQTIADQLEKARIILQGARNGDTELQARLTAVGYTADALLAGYRLYEEAGGARINAYAERGDQKGATANLNDLRDKAEGQYKTLSQIANTVFAADPDARRTLGLDVITPAVRRIPPVEGEPPAPPRNSKAQAVFLDQARMLYQGALAQPALVTALAAVGYPETRLEAELADITALEAADIQQEAQKAEAKAGTAAQKAALTQLNEWVKRFSGIVVPALKDRPDLLAKMGLKARGGKR